jgi:PKD repeat protein
MGSVLLATPAQASGCGTTVINQTSFPTTFNTSETRATGHNVIDADHTGIHVYTEGATSTDKAAAYYTGLSVPLKDQTAKENYNLNVTDNASAPRNAPGYNLVIDANGSEPGGFATLVYEPAFYGEGQWWSNSANVQGVAPGGGYAHLGTLDQYVAGNPNAVINAFGYSLGSGVKGDVVVESITFGCNVFQFRYEAPAEVPNVAPTAAFTYTVQNSDKSDYTFDGTTSTDSDGTIASYTWHFGDGSPDVTNPGPTVGHTYANAGSYDVVLTVTDNDGAKSAPVVQTVKVVKTNTVAGGGLPNTGADIGMGVGVGLAALMIGGAAYIAQSQRYKRKHIAA